MKKLVSIVLYLFLQVFTGSATVSTGTESKLNVLILTHDDDEKFDAADLRRQSLCSSWKTYGNLGGREIMKLSQGSGWKGAKNTPSECASYEDCYPKKIEVKGIEYVVEPGIHSFTIVSQFKRDEFHVALEGPELSPTFVEIHNNGTYTASYCVELPGFYKLYVRILQIDGKVSFRKDTYKSPYSIHVKSKAKNPINYTHAYSTNTSLLPSIAKFPVHLSDAPVTKAMDSCTTVREATQGRWVRFDHALRHSLLLTHELPLWEEILEITRDEYVWFPYFCRLRPMNLGDIRNIFQNLTHCVCCDSYVRTLFSATMYAVGIFDKKQSHSTSVGWFGSAWGSLKHKNWEMEGVSMSWHNNKHFETCLRKSPNGLVVQNILTDKVIKSLVDDHAAMMNNTLGKFVFFVGHPWSGDDRRNKRNNYSIQQAQYDAFTKLGSEIDIFDAFAFTWPRIYHEACDGSHVSCIDSDRLTLLSFWEILILAQIL